MSVPLVRTLVLYFAVICAVRLMESASSERWTRPSSS